jgi:Predicted membrane protein, putative toxin regulator
MKNILHRWFIEAMSFMALGLFGTLIIGLIINTAASYIPFLSSLSVIGDTAQSLTGAAIGVAIAYGLKSPPLVIFSVLAVSQHAYDLGGAAASFIVSLIIIEAARLYQQKTKLDIILTPLFTLIAGFLIAGLIGEAVGGVMTGLGDIIVFATDQQPFMMGILVSVVFGITLTAPLSSAALALMLDLSGVAAGAAVIGCCCHMVGLAAMSYKDNGVSGVISIGVGTSMLQVPNILRNPFIIMPPVIAKCNYCTDYDCLFSDGK